MKIKILELVEAKHKSSNGSCGTYLVTFLIELKITLAELKELTNELKNEKKIFFRKGINGFMIMKTTPNKKLK